MKAIDEIYTESPFYGSRKITETLKQQGHTVNRKRIQRLMNTMGLEVIYPKPNFSKPDMSHRKYPYLLKDLKIEGTDHVLINRFHELFHLNILTLLIISLVGDCFFSVISSPPHSFDIKWV